MQPTDAGEASRRAIMLPSFRLILVTFLCGFAVVFAGLRLAAVRFNESHGASFELARYGAPGEVTLTAAREPRHVISLVPAVFDTRFSVGATPAALARIAPSALERPSLPLSIAPPEDVAVKIAGPTSAELLKQPIEPEGVLAAAPPNPPDIPPRIPDSPAAPGLDAPSSGDPEP
jgi:hypothetical protein